MALTTPSQEMKDMYTEITWVRLETGRGLRGNVPWLSGWRLDKVQPAV